MANRFIQNINTGKWLSWNMAKNQDIFKHPDRFTVAEGVVLILDKDRIGRRKLTYKGAEKIQDKIHSFIAGDSFNPRPLIKAYNGKKWVATTQNKEKNELLQKQKTYNDYTNTIKQMSNNKNTKQVYRQIKKENKTKQRLQKKRENVEKQRFIPFSELFNYLSKTAYKNEKNHKKSFTITLKSKTEVNGIYPSTFFPVKNIFHLANLLDTAEKNNGNVTSNGDVILDGNKLVSVWKKVKVQFRLNAGGCDHHSNEIKERRPFTESLNYSEINTMIVPTRNNNCGFATVDYLLTNTIQEQRMYTRYRKSKNIQTTREVTDDEVIEYFVTREKETRVIKEGRLIGKKRNLTITTLKDNEHTYDDISSDCFILRDKKHYYPIVSVKERERRTGYQNVKRSVMTWDTETTPDGSEYVLHDTITRGYYKPSIQKAECIPFAFDTIVGGKSSVRQFMDMLKDEDARKRHYHIYSHNGSRFDMYFFLAEMTEQELKDNPVPSFKGLTTILQIHFYGHILKDTCQFMPSSLDKLCEDFKIKQSKLTKIEFTDSKGIKQTLSNTELCFYKAKKSLVEFMNLKNTEPEFWEAYSHYCLLDCISLYELWTKFHKLTDELFLKMSNGNRTIESRCSVQRNLTLGGTAVHLFEYLNTNGSGNPWYNKYLQFLNGYNTDIIDPEKHTFVSKCITGGISHCNQPGVHNESVAVYDITSSYPASANNMMLPIGYSHWVTHHDPTKYGFYHLTDLIFENEDEFRIIPDKVKGQSLNWKTGQHISEAYISSYDIKFLFANNGLKSFNVVKGLVSNEECRGEKIFGKYMNTLYVEKALQDALKDNKDETYNEAYREIVKLFMNALTGKLVENMAKYKEYAYVIDDEDEFCDSKNLNGVSVATTKAPQMNEKIILGLMIYSYSKRLLFEYINCLPNKHKDVIHVETDSFFFWNGHSEELEKNISEKKSDLLKIGSELGNIKLEKVSQGTSYFNGKKFYWMTDGTDKKKANKFAMKGLPENTIDENGTKIKVYDKSLFSSVYSKPFIGTFQTLKKNLFDDVRGKPTIRASTITRTITLNKNAKYHTYDVCDRIRGTRILGPIGAQDTTIVATRMSIPSSAFN